MHTCSRGPMIGRRMGWGDHNRSDHRHAKLGEREQFVRDLIAESAIEPEGPITLDPPMYHDAAIEWGTEIDQDAWLDHWDDWDHDPCPYDEYDSADFPATFEEAIMRGDIDADEAGFVDISTIDDTGPLPGWGTHLDFEDLAGLTITNRPYGFSGYGQRDR